MTTRSLRWCLLGLLALASSCADEDLTQLMVVVDTDFQVPGELDELIVEITTPAGDPLRSEGPILQEDLPLRLALVHRGGPLGPVLVKVEGLLDDESQIQRRAVVSFVRGEVRELRMDLLRECLGVLCGADETCAEGGCRSRDVVGSELPPYDGPVRTDFGVPDMGRVDMDVCVPEKESCNGLDDDCDGVVDNGFDLDTDIENCGSCGNACDPNPNRGSSMCSSGDCVLVCDEGFGDCDDDASTGCEASLSSAPTCGSCDVACDAGAPICDVDTCVSECTDGTSQCGDSCADLTSSVVNCGTCGNECPDATNASPLCTESECRLRCDMGFFNCDTQVSTGCESQLRDLANCGACGAPCAAADATTSCATGTCELVGCAMGFGDCDGELMNGCEADLASNPNTCGGCDTVCPADPANGSATCTMDACDVACDPGYADCNMDPTDGCETFLGDTSSCGGCGILCDGATPVCSGSSSTGFACSSGCGDGEVVCGASCVDTTSDARNCGGCGAACTDPPRASPTCTAGTCGFACDMGFEDCDGDVVTGCEADLASTSDCGTCGNACDPVPNGTVACQAGGCAVATCIGTQRNCDGTYATGCETDIATDADHCGGCGIVCTPGQRVTAVSCTGGACVIEACEAGYDDCDGDFATGCERQLGTKFNCGFCGDRCRGATNRCCDGVCC